MTENQDDYSGVPVIKNDWPEWIQNGGGRSSRMWRFEFEEPVPDGASDEMLSDDVLDVYIEPGASPSELVVTTTTTTENAWSDEVFFIASFRLFERLEAVFGRLRTIQGQARSMWRPFR